MRRPLALLAVPALLVGAAACGGKDDTTGAVDTETPELDLAGAVTATQAAMPLELPDSRVRVLLEDLCTAGPGDAAGIVDQLADLPLADPAQAEAVVAALEAGTDAACPGVVPASVRDEVAAGALAAAPTTTTAPAATTSGGSRTAGSTGSTGSRSSTSEGTATGTANSGGNVAGSGTSNASNGSGQVGSGNANGSGNQSSTNFGQGITSESTTTG